MNEPTCKTCIHYHQHYIVDDQRCVAIKCGHCVYPRLKHREPQNPACAHYEAQTTPPPLPDREAVTNFLTTELLKYVLSLKLPPEQIAED